MAMTRILSRRRPRKWAGPTSSFSARPCREMGLTVDVHMRRAQRADDDMMWRATLQTVWDDIPEDERAVGSRQVGSPFPEKDRTVHGRGPNGAVDRGDRGPRVPRVPDPRRERFPDAGGAGLHLRHLGRAGSARQGRGEIPRRVGGRLGPGARVSKDQARSVRDERPGAPRLREPGIPRGTPLYGEALGMSRATNHQRVK